MICKYCGAQLRPGNSICPQCGEAIRTSGGNGFWDLAGRSKSEVNVLASEETVLRKRRYSKASVIMPAVCAFAFIIMLLVQIMGASSNRKAVKAVQDECMAQISRIEMRLSELESAFSQLPRTSPVSITASPSDETQAVGFRNQEGRWLFRFEIEGSAIAFRWEKQDPDGQWNELLFDENKLNSRYGLKIDESLAEGCSKLIATGLTAESRGNYRCTVTTENGNKSVAVRLNISDADTSNLPSTSETLEQPFPTNDTLPPNSQ